MAAVERFKFMKKNIFETSIHNLTEKKYLWNLTSCLITTFLTILSYLHEEAYKRCSTVYPW
ncbi:unnamed protein product, partial [Larinioides sclopetarius]